MPTSKDITTLSFDSGLLGAQVVLTLTLGLIVILGFGFILIFN